MNLAKHTIKIILGLAVVGSLAFSLILSQWTYGQGTDNVIALPMNGDFKNATRFLLFGEVDEICRADIISVGTDDKGRWFNAQSGAVRRVITTYINLDGTIVESGAADRFLRARGKSTPEELAGTFKNTDELKAAFRKAMEHPKTAEACKPFLSVLAAEATAAETGAPGRAGLQDFEIFVEEVSTDEADKEEPGFFGNLGNKISQGIQGIGNIFGGGGRPTQLGQFGRDREGGQFGGGRAGSYVLDIEAFGDFEGACTVYDRETGEILAEFDLSVEEGEAVSVRVRGVRGLGVNASCVDEDGESVEESVIPGSEFGDHAEFGTFNLEDYRGLAGFPSGAPEGWGGPAVDHNPKTSKVGAPPSMITPSESGRGLGSPGRLQRAL